MQLGKISLHTTKTVQPQKETNKTVGNKFSTNPFGVSFKGNVIQADVFESAKKVASKTGLMERGKLFASAVVSGINNFNEAFKYFYKNLKLFGENFGYSTYRINLNNH